MCDLRVYNLINMYGILTEVSGSLKDKPSDVSTINTKCGEAVEVKDALSFDDIPGPSILKKMSKFWTYIPVFSNQITASTLQYMLSAGKIFGTYTLNKLFGFSSVKCNLLGNQLSWGNNLWLFRWLMDEYGPVVRLHGPFGGDVVLLSRPEHINVVFHNEGPFPIRSNLDSVERYRLQHRNFKNAGPFLM